MTNALPYSRKNLEAAARQAVRAGMLLDSEVAECVADAERSIAISGQAYICGVTVRLTVSQRDARQAVSIRNMSDAAFNRFAFGM